MFSRLAPSILLAACFASAALAQSEPAPSRPTLLIHGNYCGPGNRSPLAPIDVLDAACARHDACTPNDALPSKSCNRRLQVEAERIADDPGQPTELRMVAGVVASGAAVMPFAEAGRMTHRTVTGGGDD